MPPQGRLGFAEVETLVRHADAMVDRGTLDLAHVTRLDSAGIALLLELTRRARARGGAFKVEGVAPNVMALLRFFGVDALLDLDTPVSGRADAHQE
ncbi:MAG TPA: STAS domain-containing protein [Nevskiaceae bacterium]